jgi:threonine dehydratase
MTSFALPVAAAPATAHATARVTLDGIARAAVALPASLRDTPLLASDAVSARLGARVLLKLETLGPVRSFKGRGTDWYVTRLCEQPAADRPGALVCASAGNFGQGLALAGARRGIPVTVFAAESANPLKIERMRALGATVVLAGRDFDAAKEAAQAHVEQSRGATRQAAGARFVEDGREPAIAEGAGTIAVELLRDLAARGEPAPDALLVPVGNGALLAGIARWMRAHAPSTRLVAVCAEGAPAMALSMRDGRLTTTPEARTIADGIGVRVPVPEALDDLRGLVDEVRLVPDAAIVEAMRILWREHGLLVEPAGAAGLAALVADRAAWAGRTVATPLCGGNVTDAQVREWLLT